MALPRTREDKVRSSKRCSCCFDSSLQAERSSIINKAIRAPCKADDFIDTCFLRKFPDKKRLLQWLEVCFVWNKKGEYEYKEAIVFHTLFLGFVHKAILVLGTDKRNR